MARSRRKNGGPRRGTFKKKKLGANAILAVSLANAKAAAVYQGTQPLTAVDIAETAFWIATLPAHININYIEMMPMCQGFGPLAIQRSAT